MAAPQVVSLVPIGGEYSCGEIQAILPILKIHRKLLPTRQLSGLVKMAEATEFLRKMHAPEKVLEIDT